MNVTNGHARIHVIEDRLHHLVDRLRRFELAKLNRTRSLATGLRAKIEEHPIAAAATAFAVGYVVSRIARRSHEA